MLRPYLRGTLRASSFRRCLELCRKLAPSSRLASNVADDLGDLLRSQEASDGPPKPSHSNPSPPKSGPAKAPRLGKISYSYRPTVLDNGERLWSCTIPMVKFSVIGGAERNPLYGKLVKGMREVRRGRAFNFNVANNHLLSLKPVVRSKICQRVKTMFVRALGEVGVDLDGHPLNVGPDTDHGYGPKGQGLPLEGDLLLSPPQQALLASDQDILKRCHEVIAAIREPHREAQLKNARPFSKRGKARRQSYNIS